MIKESGCGPLTAVWNIEGSEATFLPGQTVFNATGPGSVVEMQHSSAIAMDLVAAITSKKEKSQTHESASVSAPSSLLSPLHQNLVEENLIEAVEVLQIPQHDWQPLARRRQCQELINLAPHHSATSHHGGGDQRPR